MGKPAVWSAIPALLLALVPRGWLVLGLVGLAPAFLGGVASLDRLALSLGGVLLAYRALQKLAAGLSHLSGAAIAWKQIVPLFHAAARPEHVGVGTGALSVHNRSEASSEKPTLVAAHDVVFRYRPGGEPVLKGCQLRVCVGDRGLGFSHGVFSDAAVACAGERLA